MTKSRQLFPPYKYYTMTENINQWEKKYSNISYIKQTIITKTQNQKVILYSKNGFKG